MLVLLVVVRWHPLVLACLTVGGWGKPLYFSTTNTLLQTSVSDKLRGRVMGVWALVFAGMLPVGGIESGFLSHAVGVPFHFAQRAFAAAAIRALPAALIFRRFFRPFVGADGAVEKCR